MPLERTSLQQFFSPCTFTPPTRHRRQRLRGRPRCKRSTSVVLNYFAYGIVAATAFKGSFQVQKASINGTLQYGVRKGASSFDFVDFCMQFSFPSTERGLLAVVLAVRSTSCSSQLFRVRDSRLCRTWHRRLPSGIGTKQTVDGVTCQKGINNLSTTCRPRV